MQKIIPKSSNNWECSSHHSLWKVLQLFVASKIYVCQYVCVYVYMKMYVKLSAFINNSWLEQLAWGWKYECPRSHTNFLHDTPLAFFTGVLLLHCRTPVEQPRIMSNHRCPKISLDVHWTAKPFYCWKRVTGKFYTVCPFKLHATAMRSGCCH